MTLKEWSEKVEKLKKKYETKSSLRQDEIERILEAVNVFCDLINQDFISKDLKANNVFGMSDSTKKSKHKKK